MKLYTIGYDLYSDLPFTCKIYDISYSTINPADCVDMHCDGKKKSIMTDFDGTLLGTPGTLLPQSERGWDTVPAYGLGDYRIPTSMMTSPDGSRLYPADICPNKGKY